MKDYFVSSDFIYLNRWSVMCVLCKMELFIPYSTPLFIIPVVYVDIILIFEILVSYMNIYLTQTYHIMDYFYVMEIFKLIFLAFKELISYFHIYFKLFMILLWKCDFLMVDVHHQIWWVFYSNKVTWILFCHVCDGKRVSAWGLRTFWCIHIFNFLFYYFVIYICVMDLIF